MYIVKIINGNITTPIHNEKHKLKSGNVVKGINAIDSFSFALLPDNPGFDLINDFTTLVSVYNTNKKRFDFYGRVLYSNSNMDSNGLITKEVTCESYFGFLCDSQQPYIDTQNWTVSGLLQHIIDKHNEQVEEYKHFKIGTVTVTDPNDNLHIGIQRENTWKTIQDKLIGQLGGEIRFRVESDGIYIDYLTEIGVHRSTEIKMSRNMKSITKEVDPSSFISRLIPLGCKLKKKVTTTDEEGNETTEEVETEDRLDISSVNNGKNYIDVENGVEVYGIHVGYAYWDDVTLPSVLLTKANNYLTENNRVQVKYSITALDLSLLGLDIDDFDVHNYHPIINPLLGIDDTARITKKNIDVCNDVQSNIEIGDNFKTLSEIQQDQFNSLQASIDKIKLDTSDLSGKVSVTQSSLNKLNTKVEGIDGTYLYIMYSPYEDGHEMTNTPDENTMYMGTCSTNAEEAPTDYRLYTWVKVKGIDGKGITKVENYYLTTDKSSGVTNEGLENPTEAGWLLESIEKLTKDKPYLWNFERTHYSDGKFSDSTPSLIGNFAKDGEKGVGIKEIQEWYGLSNDKDTEPAENDWSQELPKMTADMRYLWNYEVIVYTEGDPVTTDPLIIGVYGDKGTPGEPGPNGKTQYWHIKYSDDGGESFTDKGGETLGAWIGTYVDFNETDSDNPQDYTWKKFTEDVDEELEEIRNSILSQQTNIERNEQEISLVASKSYVETSAFETYKEDVRSEFTQRADQIDMRFISTTEQINNVDSDLQTKFEKVSKYISFNENGISIGGGPNAITLTLDNDNGIIFSKNDVPFGWWDGTDFHTGNIVVAVNERAQFGDFAFVPRSSGSLSFLKVRGSNSNIAHTHTYKITTTKSATCTETGIKLHFCDCGESYTETLAAIGHNYTSVVTPPTETSQGYTTYTCKNCGDTYKGNYTDPTPKPTYTITAKTSPEEGGTVSGGGAYAEGATVTLRAEAYPGYKFLWWSDMSTNSEKTFTAEKDATYTAYFEQVESESNLCTITVKASPEEGGVVTGGGEYEKGDNPVIMALAYPGYKFTRWSDGSTDSAYMIYVTGDATYTAYFEEDGSNGVLTDGDEIFEGSESFVEIPSQKTVVSLKFEALRSGSYTFESLDQSSLDPDGYIYSADKKTELAKSTTTGPFSVTYDFEIGTTYYLGVMLYSGSGTLKVKISYNGTS